MRIEDVEAGDLTVENEWDADGKLTIDMLSVTQRNCWKRKRGTMNPELVGVTAFSVELKANVVHGSATGVVRVQHKEDASEVDCAEQLLENVDKLLVMDITSAALTRMAYKQKEVGRCSDGTIYLGLPTIEIEFLCKYKPHQGDTDNDIGGD